MPETNSQFITHPNGQVTHFRDDNFTAPWISSETIIIQGGFGRHSTFFYDWVPRLARRFRVIRRDVRGHGLSSDASDSDTYVYNLDTILAELVDHLDQLGLAKVHFLGESTSGMIGHAFAARHPQRLLSLTTCAAPAVLPPTTPTVLAFGHASWPAACRARGARGWATALSQLPGTVPGEDAAYLQWWIDQVSVSSGEGLARYAAFLTSLDSRPFLGSIRVPTLILCPARSAVVTIADQERIQAEIAGARLVVIDGAGHEIYADKASECQDALLEFLDSLARAGDVSVGV